MTETTAVYRRRRALAIVALAVVAPPAGFLLTQRGGSDAAEPTVKTEQIKADKPAAKPLVQLPRGGRTIFPDFRVVAFYGAPQDRQLGVLGIGTPAHAARKLASQAKGYARKSR